MPGTVIVLFTRDLRVADNPALAWACERADRVVPLFVPDPRLRASANRDRFLAGCLADLGGSLRSRGADLVIRKGDPVAEIIRLAGQVGARAVTVAAAASRYGRSRAARLGRECDRQRLEFHEFPGVSVVPAGALKPTGGGDHYKVFTPYWRAWQSIRWRPVAPTPRRIPYQPDGLGHTMATDADRGESELFRGGETAGRRRMVGWRARAAGYAERHDDMAGDGTSRLSPYLHFGCVSARELATAVDDEAFRRQLCWRDFYEQVLLSFPELPVKTYRAVAEDWVVDDAAFAAWRGGHTGIPIVDAGMRQLVAEGWMHNRARLITAGYLAKKLRLDWRLGAGVFNDLLLDADVANNYGNWQWVAGTGNDTKPYRGFNPLRQAGRFDPDGTYVRRYVTELADVPGGAVHEPWKLPPGDRNVAKYLRSGHARHEDEA